ncbi:MAG: GNAT family N-acetyltransferase [Desulfobacterales bacterium]
MKAFAHMMMLCNITVRIEKAEKQDLPDILALQKTAYKSEAEIYKDFSIQPLRQTIEETEKEWESHIFLKAVDEHGDIVGSVRAAAENGVCFVGKLMVHPEFQNKGIGKSLMAAIENQFKDSDFFELFTGSKSRKNIALYEKLGYSPVRRENIREDFGLVYLRKEHPEKTERKNNDLFPME